RSSFSSADEPYAFHKYEVEHTQSKIRRAHQAGAKASIEVFHAGQYARVKDYAVGPMGFIREDGVEVKAMTLEMMDHTANCFASASKEAKDLGFDMIFLHFGHGWLPPQFLSPLFNQRTDEFGGSLENRSKFPLMILERVRKAVGPNFPIDMRISAIEWVNGSITFEDTLSFIKMAEPYIDTVQISAGLDINHEANVHMATTNFSDHMVNADYAAIVKQNVNIPVSCVGAVMNPDQAEMLLASGKVDLIGFGRSFIADPDWPNKAKDGHEEDIVPCLRCLQCYHISTNRRNVGCAVNPRYTNTDFIPKKLIPADVIKNVVIIGAGPAGINAALTASLRGHKVTILEKENHVGGALHYISKEFYKKDIADYLVYLKKQLAKSKVNVCLNTTATPELVKNLKPEAIIVAIGASAIIPPIPGIDLPQVMGFYDALSHEEKIGQKVVIIGGGSIGAEIGLELSELHHKEVTIIELTNEIAVQGNMLYRIALRQKMEAVSNLKTLMNSACQSITKEWIIVKSTEGVVSLEADTVIIATGVRANSKLAESFYHIVPDTFTIGDCNSARKIMEAVFEGHTIACNI
ncbi:MAG: FAD-dependent oxidoreductase, partial [Erysipelotrichaceae bacterium]|nr:FAD-dependent oxidoreductase [Erysipelotrichaceae bacterium]